MSAQIELAALRKISVPFLEEKRISTRANQAKVLQLAGPAL